MRWFFSFYYLKRALASGYTWAVLAGLFFLGCGWLMEGNGVTDFEFADKHGHARGGSPGLLYGLGNSILALAVLRAVLFRAEVVSAFRAKHGDTLLRDN